MAAAGLGGASAAPSGSFYSHANRASQNLGAAAPDASDGQASSMGRLLAPETSGADNGAGSRQGKDSEIASDSDGDGIELQHLDRRRSSSSSLSSSISSFYSPSSGRRSGGHGRWKYTAEEERAVVRKFDRRLVLFVAMLYMLSFLDRSNIGNARIAGMDADLQTVPPRADWYEWALTAFYLTYISFEWMALLWRVLPAHAYVACLVAGWGLAASLQAVAGSYPWLVALRVLLGIGEAGFAGIPLYLARFFRRDELALRTAIFIAAAPLATTFAASLAWAILALGHHLASPIAPWRLLFLVEGFPSVLAAVAAWRVIPDAPDQARYLTRREKQLARRRLLGDHGGDDAAAEEHDGDDAGEIDKGSGGVGGGGGSPTARRMAALRRTGRSLRAVLADPVAWITAAMFFLTNMAYSSMPVFLPTILTAMGHDAVAAQALSAPPYLAAFVLVLATAHASDRMRARAPLLIAHALASALGYGVLSLGGGVLGRASIWRYLAVYPAAVGFFNVVVLLIAWNLNNQKGESRQGGAFALLQVVGQCGPLVGTRLYPDADAPLYLRGMRTMAAAMLGVAVLAVVLRVLLRRRNGRLDAASAQRRAKKEEEEADDDDDDDGAAEDGEAGEREDAANHDEEEGLVAGRHGEGRRRGGRYQQASTFRYML